MSPAAIDTCPVLTAVKSLPGVASAVAVSASAPVDHSTVTSSYHTWPSVTVTVAVAVVAAGALVDCGAGDRHRHRVVVEDRAPHPRSRATVARHGVRDDVLQACGHQREPLVELRDSVLDGGHRHRRRGVPGGNRHRVELSTAVKSSASDARVAVSPSVTSPVIVPHPQIHATTRGSRSP